MKLKIKDSAFLVWLRQDFAPPYRVIVFAKSDKGALGKSKRLFKGDEIIKVEQIICY